MALQTAGLPVSDAAYRKGVNYLLGTQQEDGSWFVRSRSMTFQPYFDSGFPHGFDQMDLRRRLQLGNSRPLAGSARADGKRRPRTVNGRRAVHKAARFCLLGSRHPARRLMISEDH